MQKLFQSISFILLISTLFLGCVSDIDRPVDWRPTFDSNDRIPFGTYILKNELSDIFPKAAIDEINLNTGSFFEENTYEYDDYLYNIEGTYFFIYPHGFHDNKTWSHILDFVGEQNTAFIANREWNDSIKNVLGFEVDSLTLNKNKSTWVKLSTRQPEHYTNKPIAMEKGMYPTYFSKFDTTTTEVLGEVEYDGKKLPNYIRIAFQNGYLYLHAEPFVFTNYHMLKEDHHKYITKCFSYVDSYQIYWDNQNIIYKSYSSPQDGSSFGALAFVLKHKELQWAFYTLLFIAILYLVFNYKRKQRAVKVLHPYENYSLDFAKTIALLYQNSNNQNALMEQKINYFLDAIRTKYHLQTDKLNESFSELLHEKSNVPLKECKSLVFLIGKIKNNKSEDKQQFYTLHKKIEAFNRKSNLYGTHKSR